MRARYVSDVAAAHRVSLSWSTAHQCWTRGGLGPALNAERTATVDYITVVAPGSYPESLLDTCSSTIVCNPGLTLTGLRLVHEENHV